MAIHATAVAIGGRAILLLGASKCGKSTLAAALIARSSPRVPILLIGDDRILLQPAGSRLMARAHPRIAGFIERRGLGLVALPFLDQAAVAGIVCLDATAAHPDLANVPMLRVLPSGKGGAYVDQALVDRVFFWFLADGNAAAGTQVAAKHDGAATSAPKD